MIVKSAMWVRRGYYFERFIKQVRWFYEDKRWLDRLVIRALIQKLRTFWLEKFKGGWNMKDAVRKIIFNSKYREL